MAQAIASSFAPARKEEITAIAATPAVEFPTLKLQGIFFSENNPAVLINGKTLIKREKISGAQIMDIRRQTVTVQFSGETKTYTLR